MPTDVDVANEVPAPVLRLACHPTCVGAAEPPKHWQSEGWDGAVP